MVVVRVYSQGETVGVVSVVRSSIRQSGPSDIFLYRLDKSVHTTFDHGSCSTRIVPPSPVIGCVVTGKLGLLIPVCRAFDTRPGDIVVTSRPKERK